MFSNKILQRCGHCFPDTVLGVCDQPYHLLGEEAVDRLVD